MRDEEKAKIEESKVEPGADIPAVTPAPEAVVTDHAARDIVVETAEVRVVFSTRGAELRSWQLKQFVDEIGHPQDLVPKDPPPGSARPFGLEVADDEITRRLRRALYKPSVDSLSLAAQPGALTFEYRDAAGLAARKEFRFDPARHPYVVEFGASVERDGEVLAPVLQWGPGLGQGFVGGGSSFRQAPQGIFFQDGDVTRLGASDVGAQPAYEGRFGFIGVDDHYFIVAALPGDGSVRVEYQPVAAPAAQAGGGGTGRTWMAYSLSAPDGPLRLRFFVGPKEFDALAAVERDLVRAIDFGIFAVLVVPLLRALKWINFYVGNYGWSIIILTVLINAAMFPLRHKSVVSMRKMQELQPEVKAIQDRYAKLKMNDPARQKMNTELMNLYRERGVNPAGGCLPMLLTMPVLFAFYSLLWAAIELRGAPFVLWIKDLSAPDPFYVTPLLMGATMVWQQKMTPSTADATQQRIMMIMPVVFTVMFLWAPSGLVLYWFVSNLWGIGQQIVTNRIIGPPRVRTVRPPAERRLKKIGSGKTEAAREA